MTAQPLLDDAQRRVPRALVEHALILLGRMHHGGAEAAEQAGAALAEWRAASSANAQAASTAEHIWHSTSAHALQDTLALPRSAPQQAMRRRQVIGTLGVAGLATLLAGGARWYWQQPLAQLALSTARGQQRTHRLEDGSVLQLGADTALQATLWRDRRLVALTRGEARFSVEHDAQRPFVVQTPRGRVQVLGTVFHVSLRSSGLHIAVEQGRVAVWSAEHANDDAPPQQILAAGQWLLLGEHEAIASGTASPQAMADWTQGWLVFDNTPLPDAVARWNAYLRQPLRLDDSAPLARLHVSGSYRLTDPQAFVRGLPQMLPVRTLVQADGTVQISMKR